MISGCLPRCTFLNFDKLASASGRRAGVAVLALLSVLIIVQPVHARDEARRLVALLDYLGGDYANAVRDGKIVNQDEYAEMQEFSKRILELLGQLKAASQADTARIEPTLKSLAELVESKGDAAAVAALASNSKERLITAFRIIPYPRRLPNLAAGKRLYLENCAQCHGESGKGDGPGRSSMNPKTPAPANFTDPDRMAGLSPFKAFNTASFGIDGTAMASFAALTEEQRWQVAFYLFTLRFTNEEAQAGAALFRSKKLPADFTATDTLATNTDEQLLAGLIPHTSGDSQARQALAYLRLGLLGLQPVDPLAIARIRLREASELYSQGEKEKAYQKAVEAYLDGFEMVEPALFAKDASFGRSIEALMTDFRNAIRQGLAPVEIQKRQVQLASKLDQAAEILTREDSFPAYYAFANSALIIIREGLEAALILAAILAMLQVMGAAQATRYIHLGWILALIAGLMTWVATETMLTLSGQHRESMEGFISIFAAIALFYVGYWLHTRAEARRWQAFLQEKVKNVLSAKKILGLVGISFFAVYREAFEVVLFYQALWLQNEQNRGAVLWGFAGGALLLIIMSVGILKLGLRIPLKYFFGVTGTLLYIVAFIFAGSGVKELQAALWVPTTPVNYPLQVPILGIYPTVETLAAQGAMLLAFVATSFWMAKEHRRTA